MQRSKNMEGESGMRVKVSKWALYYNPSTFFKLLIHTREWRSVSVSWEGDFSPEVCVSGLPSSVVICEQHVPLWIPAELLRWACSLACRSSFIFQGCCATLGFNNTVTPLGITNSKDISQAFFINVINFETFAFIFARKCLTHLVLGIHCQDFGKECYFLSKGEIFPLSDHA